MKDLFLIFTGLPASGKTSLAHELAVRLKLAFIDKDNILEELFESLGCRDFAERQRLSRASDRIMKSIVGKSHGAAVVSFWSGPSVPDNSGTSIDWISELRGDVIEIYCDCSPGLAAKRFAERERHPNHFDSDRDRQGIEDRFAALSKDGPLGLGKLVRVNTSINVDITGTVKSIESLIHPLAP